MKPRPTKCRSCAAPIVWAVSATSGRLMPLDAEPAPGGNVRLEHTGGHWVAHVIAATTPGAHYTSHFLNCPQAKQWRRKP